MAAATLARATKSWTRRAARTARDRLGVKSGASRLPDRVRERLKIIRRWAYRLRDLQPDDLPAQWRSQPCGVPGAQVVAVRFGVGRERAEHRGGLRVHVGERRNRRLTAGGPGASAKRAHEREG